MSTHGAPPPGGPGQGAGPGMGGAPPTEPYQAPYPPQGYDEQRFQRPPGPGYDQGGGPGFGERAQHAADVVARHVKTPETKEFFKTSEFLVWALSAITVLIAAAVISGSGNTPDIFTGDRAWLYFTILSAAYIISRGIAKSGTKRGYGDAPMDRDSGRGY